jgi:phenylalanyl-tRNA synthetase alpha subunit
VEDHLAQATGRLGADTTPFLSSIAENKSSAAEKHKYIWVNTLGIPQAHPARKERGTYMLHALYGGAEVTLLFQKRAIL